jgi:membrane protein implicated in regulation of membrane protease activity
MMAFSSFWWLLAGLAVIAEMLTGTVYLLLIGAGFVAAALAAHLGLAPTVQIVLAAMVGAALVFGWWRIRAPARRATVSAQTDASLNLDIGQTVMVDHWGADGTASVMHRGARWTVVTQGAETGDIAAALPAPAAYRIVALSGSAFVVEPIPIG